MVRLTFHVSWYLMHFTIRDNALGTGRLSKRTKNGSAAE
uniref:Uncharacterized protein n=1 Tax=Anguilla anguilla TaxID=7936 RepID=A0A0E9VVY8_ANGAN